MIPIGTYNGEGVCRCVASCDFKDVDEFGKNKSAKYELNVYCKKCWNFRYKK